ncbi:MAG: glycosyl hydrolase [Syntrophothermus sp.]
MVRARLRRRGTAHALALALSLVSLLVFAAGAQALPASFWGAVPQSTLSAEQFERLGRGGVESVRIPVDWSSLQPQAGGPIQWEGMDVLVERAALAGIDVLPTVSGAPGWAVPSARVPGGHGATAPAHLPTSGAAATAWKALLTAAVRRYGPEGEFWASHPAVPKRPIRTWQIGNEPNFKFFVTKPNPAEYGKLVKLSFTALRSADPGARVVLAGLFSQPKGGRHIEIVHGSRKLVGRGSPNYFASYFLEVMYRSNPGIASRFAAVALHPYTGTWQYLTPEIEEIRDTLRASDDARKGLWITELGWSSQPPQSDGSNGFAKGPQGQVNQLKGAFKLLLSKRAKWRIQRVYWFSVDDAKGVCNFCDGTGLFGAGFKPKKSWNAYVAFTGGTP